MLDDDKPLSDTKADGGKVQEGASDE